VAIDQIGNGRGRQNRRGVDQSQMQPDGEPGQPARDFDRVGRGGRSDHEARGREDALKVGDFDRAVHLIGEAEIVGRDDEKFQWAISWRSRRKRKNSAPSRRRRFMTSGLFTISPRIEAILPGRK
jgi:hypothetical protein